MGIYWLKLCIVLPIIISLLWLLSQWAQRSTVFSPKASYFSIVDKLQVSPKSSLQVVRVGQSCLLLSVTDQQVTLLKELNPEEVSTWQSLNPPLAPIKGWVKDFSQSNQRAKSGVKK